MQRSHAIRTVARALAQQYAVPLGSRAGNLVERATAADRQRLGEGKDLTLFRVLGKGEAGTVWSARDGRGRWWAVKMQEAGAPFMREVHQHRLFAARGCGLPIEAAWVTGTTGVIKMPPIEDPLEKVAQKNRDNPALLQYLAEEVKKLHARMRSNRLVHGDMHMMNMAMMLSDNRRRPSMVLIDFERSFELVDPPAPLRSWLEDADAFWLWRSVAWAPFMHKYFVNAGFPASSIMQEVVGDGRPKLSQANPAVRKAAGILLRYQTEMEGKL